MSSDSTHQAERRWLLCAHAYAMRTAAGARQGRRTPRWSPISPAQAGIRFSAQPAPRLPVVICSFIVIRGYHLFGLSELNSILDSVPDLELDSIADADTDTAHAMHGHFPASLGCQSGARRYDGILFHRGSPWYRCVSSAPLAMMKRVSIASRR